MSEQDGGIMQKILSMTSPPNANVTSKQRRSKQQPRVQPTPPTRQTGIDNRPYCEACGDGGDLLCCERCPSSFHFSCCDPPLDSLHLPEGEWVCQGCRPSPAHLEEHSNTIFRPLLMQCCSENPLVFSLPEDLMSVVALKDVKQERRLKQDATTMKFCYACNKSSKYGRIINCDFCPLSFHMDCLTPPLTDTPISSSWMCPNHVEHKITDLQDARLTKRIEALEKCRTEISRQAIKMDFLKTLNKIPHYQRNVTRTNRRASEVPMAIKAMYSDPLVDSHHAPCLSDLLVTASEELEMLRRQGEIERETLTKQMTASSASTTTAEEQDKWTRHAVLSQVVSSSLTTNHYRHHQSTTEDLKDILGVNDLSNFSDETMPSCNETTPTCNGFNTDNENPTMETNKSTNQKHCNDGLLNSKKHLNGLIETTPTVHMDNNFLPDVSQLDNNLVRLLAEQRLKELFADQKKTHLQSLSCENHVTQSTSNSTGSNRHIKSEHHLSVSRRSQDARSPLGLLCPISSYGPAHLLYKRIITIGSSSDMDISLNDYGHCNFISAHHACLILDKDSSENELINYSEHGSIVDGVLYSCDFSDKTSNEVGSGSTLLLLDDIMAQGTGIRADKAKRRLESARKCLQEKTQASKALSAAFKLSKSIVKDCTPDSNVVAGLKRRKSCDESSASSPNSPASSIVSIPLAKTKKTTNHKINNDKYIEKKKFSPEKKPPHPLPALEKPLNYKPCLCKRSASSLIGSGGKGWEGAAMVSHGSKLRFGCIQLVLSISNKPGFNELQQALRQQNLL